MDEIKYPLWEDIGRFLVGCIRAWWQNKHWRIWGSVSSLGSAALACLAVRHYNDWSAKDAAWEALVMTVLFPAFAVGFMAFIIYVASPYILYRRMREERDIAQAERDQAIKDRDAIPQVEGHWIGEKDGLPLVMSQDGDKISWENSPGPNHDHKGFGTFRPECKVFEVRADRTNRQKSTYVPLYGYLISIDEKTYIGIIVKTPGGDGVEKDHEEAKIYRRGIA